MRALELWGGVECTVNRVGQVFRDQLRETGHDHRPGDLDMIADLGFTALRFPILWERVVGEDPKRFDWRWTDLGLDRLRQRGVRPVAGLVHHGSGPKDTNLLADDFAGKLADYAGAVARRYPWIIDWTPINEPLTTARFSALYGYWYPHARDERAFWVALINQIDATRLAMQAIRAVQPAARLIQTDDLGRTYATVALRDQAAFDNSRRWMGWDLLCGRVTPEHALWSRLIDMGFETRLRQIAADPCPPDVIGINHYLTSDRFLDHRVHRYPSQVRGGNQQRPYIDIEAIRVLEPAPRGLECAMSDAWERYRIPLAITEVHNGCTREEQMRWTLEAWSTAQALRGDGVAVEAVTSWALLGNQGWDRLLTERGGYESGCFDVSSGHPRPTALTGILKNLARGEAPAHPVLAGPGWWRRDIRLHHAQASRPAPVREYSRTARLFAPPVPPLLITGGTGTLGQALAAACRHRAIAHVLTTRAELDLADAVSIADALDKYQPWAVINAAGWVRVDDAEGEEAACYSANSDGAVRLAEACAERGIASVLFSSDLVFDGSAGRAYHEGDRPAPLNIYGRSKAQAEHAISQLGGKHLIVRTAAFFSPMDRHNFAVHAADALAQGQVFVAAADQIVTPTYVPDLARAVLDLVIDGECGIWHLSNGDAVSWSDFARMVAISCGYNPDLVKPTLARDMGWRAPRPLFVPLSSVKGSLLPTLADAIERFARDYETIVPAINSIAA